MTTMMIDEEEPQSQLSSLDGGEVALKGVKVQARLRDLMAQVEVEQTYENPADTNIEAVYTFPLPIGAVMLGLEFDIGGRKLAGQIIEKKEAERCYEDAVTDGDTALMLQEAEEGLYTANLGNLMPGEQAVIRYRYGLLMQWQGNKVRFLLPTTIAPRYGNPASAGLEAYQVPSASLMVDYPLDIEIMIEGSLAQAEVSSPSHAVVIERSEERLAVKLAKTAWLDRDFVLNLEQSSAPASTCIQAPDKNGYVALASLRIPPHEASAQKTLSLKVVIDCSGSMAGTSIIQARKAALEILNLLRPQDRFNITLFGNSQRHLFQHMILADEVHLARARVFLENLQADMGGTEMAQALEAVFTLSASGKENVEESSLILITDGESWDCENIIQGAIDSAHRVFTVGVGNAVAEGLVKELAEATGGACELAAPREGMAEKVLAQFHRLRQPRISGLNIQWPTTPEWATPLPETAYAGDTVHLYAGFGTAMTGEVRLDVTDADGNPIKTTAIVTAQEDAELPRMAVAARICNMGREEALPLALDYQLISTWTHALVVAERIDKAEDLPVLHQVPQMLAAGWGGTGAAGDFMSSIALESIVLPKNTTADFMSQIADGGWELNELLSLDTLKRMGLEDEVLKVLHDLVDQGWHESMVIISFLYAVSESPIGKCISRLSRRVLFKAWKDARPEAELDGYFKEALANVEFVDNKDSHWGYRFFWRSGFDKKRMVVKWNWVAGKMTLPCLR